MPWLSLYGFQEREALSKATKYEDRLVARDANLALLPSSAGAPGKS